VEDDGPVRTIHILFHTGLDEQRRPEVGGPKVHLRRTSNAAEIDRGSYNKGDAGEILFANSRQVPWYNRRC
jgi:hypothetical protein